MKRKAQCEGYRVDIRLAAADGAYAPHTADCVEKWMADAVVTDLKRAGQPGRLVKVLGRMKFPAGAVLEAWEGKGE
jgi:hypothetical protein